MSNPAPTRKKVIFNLIYTQMDVTKLRAGFVIFYHNQNIGILSTALTKAMYLRTLQSSLYTEPVDAVTYLSSGHLVHLIDSPL